MDTAIIIILFFVLFINCLTLLCCTEVYSRVKDLQNKLRKIQHGLDEWGIPEDGETAD